jgi:hypothetical protein
MASTDSSKCVARWTSARSAGIALASVAWMTSVIPAPRAPSGPSLPVLLFVLLHGLALLAVTLARPRTGGSIPSEGGIRDEGPPVPAAAQFQRSDPPIRSPAAAPVDPNTSGVASARAIAPCRSRLRVAVAVGGSSPALSYAVLTGDDGRATAALRVGSPLGRGRVAAIGYGALGPYVLVSAAGARSCAFGPEFPAESTPVEPSPPRAASQLDQLAAVSITRLGDSEFRADRAVLARLMADPTLLARSVQAVPASEGGHVGIRVRGNRGSTLLGALGLRDGDLLVGLNGHPLDSADHWIEALSVLQHSERLGVAVMRAGRPMQIDVEIR